MKKEFKIVICGGGSTYTAGIVKNLLEEEELKIKELWLYDIDQERQEKVSLIVKEVVKDLRPSLELKISTDEEEAFTDADFIMAQMRVGGLKMRVKDEQISLKHGCIGQETCGAGGMAYGMRTIGPMVHLIDVCEKYASKTYWIVNYSNPAAIVAKATQTLRPNARILNICDMPVEVEARMAEILDTDLSNLEVDYFGLNHYGWFTKVRCNGEDVTEKLKKPAALICATDRIAQGAYKVLYEKEIAIPDEVSVVGFGDYETGELMRPPLTTVKFDWRNWGESSAETMLQMIQQKPVSTIQVNPYEFIERKSVR